MIVRTIGMVAACLGLCVSPAFAQGDDDSSVDAPVVENWAMTVIELGYADAQEVAALLSEIVPPGVSVVPYYQTNSLIISGDRALIEELTRGGEDGADAGAGAENEASDRSPKVAEGELTARR